MFKNQNSKAFHAILMAILFSTPFYAPVYAKDKSGANKIDGPLLPLYDCIKISDNATRLACYDKIATEIEAKEKRNEIVLYDAPKIEQIRKESFGFSVPTLFKNDPKQEDVKVSLVATKINDGSRAIIYFDNGQVWQLTDVEDLNLSKKPPIKATISKAAMGSFMLQFEGKNRGFRVKRIE